MISHDYRRTNHVEQAPSMEKEKTGLSIVPMPLVTIQQVAVERQLVSVVGIALDSLVGPEAITVSKLMLLWVSTGGKSSGG